MKGIYSFVAKKNNETKGCDSCLLSSEYEAKKKANSLLEIFIDVNIIEIFKYENSNFEFLESVMKNEHSRL
ncbi:hypothetical protein [Bacillus thuringiensis]|uniref:hypothetical protein n=1 Tax=Bacillus thuringiensis TaxID=1428 RepID=UPI00119E7308|nr:hypothetical protein [Bacillus thuringiensis]